MPIDQVRRNTSGWLTALALALASLCAAPQTTAQTTAQNSPQSYFEFGTIVAIGRGTIDIQTFDERLQKTVQHSFALSKESKADVVRYGDSVEIIFSLNSGGEWTVRRMVVLSAGIPKAGPPPRAGSTAATTLAGNQGPVKTVPRAGAVALPTQGASNARVAKPGSVTLPAQSQNGQRSSAASTISLPAPAAARSGSAVASVDLGSPFKEAVPEVKAIPLGVPEIPAAASSPRIRTVAQAEHGAECNRSDASWPANPISIAVLDFRYPTEREEAHDVGTTGGGSGTAVADLVYDRLSQGSTEIAYSRGDRDKLYRADFAGAARLGRRMGVDAVLAGTFQPIDQPLTEDGFAPPVIYELRAGLVDTCTGQLLERFSSAVCPGGIDTGGTQSGCTRRTITAKQASDPKETVRAFTPALDALLLPLEHGGTPPGQRGSAGVVSNVAPGVNGTSVTISLAPGARQKVGDVIALHAWRLGKNASTYTLHRLVDEEIGRITVSSVAGGSCTGTFAGDFAPRVGDTAESITE